MAIERITSQDLLVIPQGSGGVMLKIRDGLVIGEKGEKGDAGPPGPAGATGATGPAGSSASVSITSAGVASLVAIETSNRISADAVLSVASGG